jgi:hypothetical protein
VQHKTTHATTNSNQQQHQLSILGKCLLLQQLQKGSTPRSTVGERVLNDLFHSFATSTARDQHSQATSF